MGRDDGPWADGRRAWDRLRRDRLNTGDDAVDALSDIGTVRRLLDQAELLAVRAARRHGKSWAEIATRLGVSRQSAWERWRDLDDEPQGGSAAAEHSVVTEYEGIGEYEGSLGGRAGPRRRRSTVRVPQVVGLSWDEARVCLIEVGLHGVPADPDASPIMLGGSGHVVTDQSPEAGARVEAGTAVQLWVSRQGGGSAGVREPRRPKPSPRSTMAEPRGDALDAVS